MILIIVICIGIPVLVEFLTFIEMIHLGFSDTSQAPTSSSSKQQITIGETVDLGNRRAITIHNLSIQARKSGWLFHITCTLQNHATQNRSFRSQSITLKNGETVPFPFNQSVDPESHLRQTYQLAIPRGTTPVSWRFQSPHPDGKSASSVRSISFGNIPVQRTRNHQSQ